MGKKLSLLILVCLVGTSAHAGECQVKAQEAAQKGVRHLVVSFEGLASYAAGFVRKGLIAPLSSRYPGQFHSANFSYTSSARAAACIRDWKKVLGDQLHISVIGHSFGGGIAVFKLLDSVRDIRIDEVLTLDPRSWSTDWSAATRGTIELFQKPANVDRFVNCYQRGGMPGYKVRGAENIQISGTSHTRLPRNAQVFQVASDLLFN